MAEESRENEGNKRIRDGTKDCHNQASKPVDIERPSSLSSEGEDELLLWGGMEAPDAAELQDHQATSLTPSEGTEHDGGSPARFARAHSLSPDPSLWSSNTSSTNANAAAAAATTNLGVYLEGGVPNNNNNSSGINNAAAARRNGDGDGDRDGDRTAAPAVYSRAEEELAHLDFLAQLQKASHQQQQHQQQQHQHHYHATGLMDTPLHNGNGSYHIHSSLHDDTPPSSWSPGDHDSPDGRDGVPLSPDALRGMLACPFCQRTYRREPALREHIRFCHEREEGQSTCHLCGFSTPYRAQMERHMMLHSQQQEKQPLSDPAMENRKFKCVQCGKAFKYKHHLKEHLRIHSGEKPYECSNCKKRFSHSGSYSSHLSSKKCLNGGGGHGGGGGPGSGPFNGHSHPTYLHTSPTSPPTPIGRNHHSSSSTIMGKSSPYNQDRQQLPADLQALPLQGEGALLGGLRGRDLSRLWDPTAELSLRASIFKGTTLLPYLHSGSKFEHLLQEMLRREVGQRPDGAPIRMEEEEEQQQVRRPAGGGGGRGGGGEARGSPESSRPGEAPSSGGGGVTCRWCSQLFPNTAVLLQHERYLCKTNRSSSSSSGEAVSSSSAMEPLESPRLHKDPGSSPLNFSRPPAHPHPHPHPHPHEPPKTPTALSNGFAAKDPRSPLQRSPWQSVPQQLLVALHSPIQLRSEPSLPSSRPYWPGAELGSPVGKTPVSPATASVDMPSTPLHDRRRLLSPGFPSPLGGLDLSSAAGVASAAANIVSPAGRAGPPRRTPGSAGSQAEPLDLSLPKPPGADPSPRERPCNGTPRGSERRDAEGPYRRLTPPSPQSMAGYGAAPPMQPGAPFGGAPMFGGSVYGPYPLFNPMLPPAGLRGGGGGHEGMPSLPVNRGAPPNAGFLSPMAYMLDSDTESMLKRIHQERQALMNEALNRGCLDYLSVMEEGLDGDGVPGRKRLRKTEEGLYACDICDKTFQKSSSLLRHKYEHTGKRPHECKICKKAFKHKHHLIEHSRLHSGEKPYQCDKCGKRFSHSGSYSQHMNHRYAYCSRDAADPDPDPDADAEDTTIGEEPGYRTPGLELTPTGGGQDAVTMMMESNNNNSIMGNTNAINSSTTPEETTSNFLSDSSLDGGLQEEEEDEDEEEEEEEGVLGGGHREELERAEEEMEEAEGLGGSASLAVETGALSRSEEEQRGGNSSLANGRGEGGGGGGERTNMDLEGDDHCDQSDQETAMELTPQNNNTHSPGEACDNQG